MVRIISDITTPPPEGLGKGHYAANYFTFQEFYLGVKSLRETMPNPSTAYNALNTVYHQAYNVQQGNTFDGQPLASLTNDEATKQITQIIQDMWAAVVTAG